MSARELPFVSVIVPAYNAQGTIDNCIQALLTQDYPADRYEIIVVDNNSTDHTASIVGDYPVTLLHERDVQTSYAARNRGIKASHSEIVAFIDADCVAEPDWLYHLLRPFADDGVGVTGGRLLSQPPDEGLVETFLAQVKVTRPEVYDSNEPKGFPTNTVAYRRAAFARVGLFDAAMPGGGDIDLAWRVQAIAGFRGVYVDKAIVYHKHLSSLKGMISQYRRYGTSDIVLSTVYRGAPFHRRTPRYQVRRMVRHVRALATYCASFAGRLFRWRRWRSDRLYLAWPLLWFVLESGVLLGRIEGLLKTRFFHRNPYPSDHREVIRQAVNTPSLPGVQEESRSL